VEVKNTIISLKSKNSTGYDGISNKILKHCINYVSNLHVCNVHQQYQGTFLLFQTDAHNYKNHRNIETIKIPTIAPTCFGSPVYSILAQQAGMPP